MNDKINHQLNLDLGTIMYNTELLLVGVLFGGSVNPIPTRGGRLCPPHYCWHPPIRKPVHLCTINVQSKNNMQLLFGLIDDTLHH